MKNKSSNTMALTLSLCLLGGSSAIAQVTFPYTNDFSVGAADFTSSGAGTWAAAAGEYENEITTFGSRSASAVDVTGIGGPTPVDFQVSSDFTINGAINNASFGFAVFGDSVAAATSNYLLLDFSADNNIRILNVGGPGTGTIVNQQNNATGFTFADGLTYSLVADFQYTGTLLDVTLTVTGNSTSGTITALGIPTIGQLDSSIIGITNRTNGIGPLTTLTNAVDNFSVIPEPSTYAVFIAVGIGIFFLRRRLKA